MMDDDLKKWQSNWQKQPVPTTDAKELITQFNQIERSYQQKTRWLNISMILTVIIIGTLALWQGDTWSILGVGTMITAILMILRLNSQARISPVAQIDDLDNQEFIQQQVTGLERQSEITTKYMRIYAALLIIGINIAYVSALGSLDFQVRIGIHALVTIVMAGVFYFSIQKYRKRQEQEVEPIVESLRQRLND